MSDNIAVIIYINNVGDIESNSCIKIVCNICDFCVTKKPWISAIHIPGLSNKEADKGVMIGFAVCGWVQNLECGQRLRRTYICS